MLILASASKARLELLGSVGISPDKILNTNIDETPKKSQKPLDYVSRIALEKNKAEITEVKPRNEISEPQECNTSMEVNGGKNFKLTIYYTIKSCIMSPKMNQKGIKR